MKTSSRRRFLGGVLAGGGSGATVFLPATPLPQTEGGTPVINVRESGAVGDGSTLNTGSLQGAIDRCARGGGGTVYFPPGTYLTGTLQLRSRVTLRLEAGAVLQGSRNLADYKPLVPALRSYTDNYTDKCLLYGEGLESVAIEGRGAIDGQGAAFEGPYKLRPYLIRMVSCRDVSIRHILIRDSPMWVQHYLACDGVLIDGITVRSRCNRNNDGIDIDGCRNVRIANCDISSGDDAIVLKSTLDRPCRDVVVTNCVLSSDCNAFKLGTESNGGFENIVFGNCAIHDTRLAGIALEIVDGGVLDRVSISNVTMRNVNGPVFVRLGNRARPFRENMAAPGIGSLRNVLITGLTVTGADNIGCSITGLPQHPVEGIALENIRISFAGGGTEDDANRPVPEYPEKYPEYRMFGTLPAYGFFCRHARGLRFSNIRLECPAGEERSSLVCENVEDLELFGWSAARAPRSQPVIRFSDVRDAWIHGCRSPRGARDFLDADGRRNENIRLESNVLS